MLGENDFRRSFLMRIAMHKGILSIAFLMMALPLCSAAQTLTGTLEKIKISGAITLGYREASIPFSYLDNNAKPVGFAQDICLHIVDEVKKYTNRPNINVNFQAVTSNNRMLLMKNGTIDIECGSTTNNVERQSQVAFGINYFYTGTRFLVKKGTTFKSINDLMGKDVVATAGTSNVKVLRTLSEKNNLKINLLTAKDHGEAFVMVETGRAFAFGMDDVLLFGLRANAKNPSDWDVVGDALQVEPYSVMMRRDDPEFKKLVDQTITRLIKTGEFEKLYIKWFQSPIPPKGVNLSIPMSKELRNNLITLSDRPV
jgi:ABC-type amino acid transport substrate-binding protein